MKSHVLDYVFKFHRQKIQSNKMDKAKLEDYIYDLENTWSINTDILVTMLHENTGHQFTSENKRQLCLIIDRIKDLAAKKKSLRENKMKIRGKLLMDKQIMEEYKRRNEENIAYYSEQMEEYNENLDKKESFIKQFLKKFNEVEIYVQREAKNSPSKWENLESFEIAAFINNNENMQERKIAIMDEINNIRQDMNVILRENVDLKKREEYLDISDDNDDPNTKYENLINNYESKIKYFERNNENLKNVLNKLSLKWERINSVNPVYNRHQRNISMSVPGHKKINSKAEIFFRDLNMVNVHEETEEENNNKIYEEGDENNEEEKNEEKNEEVEENLNKSCLNIEVKNDSINNEEHSIFNNVNVNKNTPEFTMNKEQWDISCILENL